MDEKELKEILSAIEKAGWRPELCDTPVRGNRFRDYLNIALTMGELLSNPQK